MNDAEWCHVSALEVDVESAEARMDCLAELLVELEELKCLSVFDINNLCTV